MSSNKQNLTMSKMSQAEVLFGLTPAQALIVETRVCDNLCKAYTGTREDDYLEDRIRDTDTVLKFYLKVRFHREWQYNSNPTKHVGLMTMQARYAVWWLNQWIEDLRSSADLAGRV